LLPITEQLKEILKQPLPGWSGQSKLSSVGYDSNREAKPSSKKAAVLLVIYQDVFDNYKLVYIKRPSNNPNDKHGGQISFPGGQVENLDPNLEHTALRETYEEIGIPNHQLEIVGALSKLYVFVSDFLVFPYVAVLKGQPAFIPQETEVDKIISHPIQHLLDFTPLTKDLHIRSYKLKNVPFYDLNGETLWGATAMITSEFLELIRRERLQL